MDGLDQLKQIFEELSSDGNKKGKEKEINPETDSSSYISESEIDFVIIDEIDRFSTSISDNISSVVNSPIVVKKPNRSVGKRTVLMQRFVESQAQKGSSSQIVTDLDQYEEEEVMNSDDRRFIADESSTQDGGLSLYRILDRTQRMKENEEPEADSEMEEDEIIFCDPTDNEYEYYSDD